MHNVAIERDQDRRESLHDASVYIGMGRYLDALDELDNLEYLHTNYAYGDLQLKDQIQKFLDDNHSIIEAKADKLINRRR